MKIIVVAWTGEGGRSTALADGLDADIYNIQSGMGRRSWNGPLRYLSQGAQTARVLLRSKPDRVIVQNPPIVAAVVVFVIQKLFRSTGDLIIDSHTGAFLDPKWSRFLSLHRWLSERSALTLVHNSAQARIVDEWKVPWLVVPYVQSTVLQQNLDQVAAPGDDDQQVVFAVCSGGYDEPMDEIADAARKLPDVLFKVTGRSERILARLSEEPPANMRLLDLLPYDDYLEQLTDSSVVLTLSTREDTLLNGGFEAIACRKPLVTSDSEVLRDYFCQGTVHTKNDTSSIASAIDRALRNLPKLNEEMTAYSLECDAEWVLMRRKIREADGGIR